MAGKLITRRSKSGKGGGQLGGLSFTVTQNTSDVVLRKFLRDSPKIVAKLIRRATTTGHSGMKGAVRRDSGKLSAGILRTIRPSIGTAGVQDKDLFYGRFLEFGTARQKATPFVLPAWTKATKNVERDLERELDKP